MIDPALITEALAAIDAEATYAHDKRTEANNALQQWQSEGERLHHFVDCDHNWEPDSGFITCQMCGWSHMEPDDV